ncbi:citrate/2-methylcitrate synthase [Inmirania thermothiophila]|uniref:Citrate synthase n=1 Tax=Inmirania thermothiophila TaxID=1750597 RepID=A0A3N1XZL9_9GAMM|nr:citrate/2-methylcitrate synthase [Inmirania thermothiophila]ROR32019.1 citrate synthase [Inmirania thermothiophila]
MRARTPYGPGRLRRTEGRYRTRMGKCFPGERVVFRGLDLHRDLARADWVDLWLYGAQGRRYTRAQIELIHAMWVYTSYPDPRIWNNRVCALAGTARSTAALAVGAAIAVSEATIYGRRADLRAADFLRRARARREAGESIEAIVTEELRRFRGVPGFGRPIVRGDERIPHLLARARELGLDGGPHLALAREVEAFLQAGRWRFQMNFAGLTAALCADMGMSPRDYYVGALLVFAAGMPPCYLEALEHEENGFFPLPVTSLAYEGPARRRWPGTTESAPPADPEETKGR